MKKIFYLSSTRADFSLVKNILKKIDQHKDLQLYLIVTGSHLMKSHGMTINEILDEKITIYKKINFNMQNIFSENLFINRFIRRISDEIKIIKPDIYLSVGDRLEMYLTAFSAFINNHKIFHIHGGEITNGSKDNTFRYLISRLSNCHFVVNSSCKKRLIRTGENPNSIFNIGSLAKDNIAMTKTLDKSNLEKKLGFKLNQKNILLNFHPDTSMLHYHAKDFDNILRTLSLLDKKTLILFTYPNVDIGFNFIIDKAKKYKFTNKNFKIVKSLGSNLYYSVLKYFDLVIGNSSSAIHEAPLFNIKILNIGSRQKDRAINDKKIINSSSNFDSIKFNLLNLIKKKRKKFKIIQSNNAINKILNKIIFDIDNYQFKEFYEKKTSIFYNSKIGLKTNNKKLN